MPNAEGHERQCVARAYVRAETPGPDGKYPALYDDDGNAIMRRCRKFAIRGSTVCDTHGGSTSHVKRAARRRLEYGRDAALERLIEIIDNHPDPETAIKAAAQLLKYTPPVDEEDPADGIRDAIAEVKELAQNALPTDSTEAS